MSVPTNYVTGPSNQMPVLPMVLVPTNTVIPTPGLPAWPGTAVPQSAVMQPLQPVIPVQPVVYSADSRPISLEDFHKEVGKKLRCVSHLQAN